MIHRLASRVVLLWGWRRGLVACAAGALSALAMPPFGLFPLMSAGLTLAVWLLDGTGSPRGRRLPALRSAAAIGWWFGFGYFLAGLWWIGEAFLVDADDFLWLMPVAVLVVPAGLALFHAAAFALARLIWAGDARRILALAAPLAGFEWLRGHVLTGFPWNALGYALAGEIHLAQILSVVGLPGLTLVAVAILASPATLADRVPGALRAPALGLVALAGLAGFGFVRLARTPVGTVAGVHLRLMQPDVQQDDKFRPEAADDILSHYLELSARRPAAEADGLGPVTHLIWPESAFPTFIARDTDALQRIGRSLAPGAVLLTGASRVEGTLQGDSVRFYNAVHVIDGSGTILDTYDKVHLVPFGEYLPFQSALEWIGLRQLTQQRGGFSAGRELRTLDVPGAPPVGMLICYEAIFPGHVLAPGSRPGWLLNVTNDAWFGLSPGPYQHFQQARARAIEEGLPLVRAANNGISAVVDPLGRVIGSLPLGAAGIVDASLPGALQPTPYSGYGDGVFAAMLMITVLVSVVRRPGLAGTRMGY